MAPTIFTQLFTIMGSVTEIHKEKRRTIALPLAYALLSSKQTEQYKAVLRAIVDAADGFKIPNLQ